MKITNLIFLILLFYSCGNRTKNNTEKKLDTVSIKTDTISLSKECVQNDTITASGTKIKYVYRKGKYKISYGDKYYNRIYDSLYTCDYDKNTGLWDFVPKLQSETKNNLIFTNILWTSSGGNPAPLEYYAIVLPKNKKDKGFEKDFFIICQEDYLVYGDPETENIHIINLETKKTQLIKLKPKPEFARSPTLSIQETNIKKNTLHIKYQSLDKNDEAIIIETKYKIGI
ncbi:hypothetical protein GKZ90_0005860 [Flavobacterium sp. MC2016-06]|jgi:hypothetical protein|uniref:hypothetical protein n=1 Tax=Flavobacterium sp. MC2016-06 TaxID=2676308 RepID=UPI0012BADFEB|nr:hypothetical protein [Flavobacterium sp. MC2016-06]MBU3857663.1 hypothetical protein [Flavobacterium sp. MC2016-06]